MKNKTNILAVVLALPLCLTACDKNGEGEISTSTSSSSSSSSSSISSSSSVESSSDIPADSSQPSENNFPESFTGYLGETLYGADASEHYGRKVIFDDFTYLRWAAPFFDNTLKTPDLIDWDTYDMPKYDDIIKQKNPNWFLVKPGDVLENGLVVKSVYCSFEDVNYFDDEKGTFIETIMQIDSEVFFENTLTLRGVLYCTPEDDLYITNGDLFFFADSTVNSNIPVINEGGRADEFGLLRCVFSDAAFICDGMYYRVGNLDSVSVDLSGIIKRGGICEVNITLDNIKLRNHAGVDNGSFADIVSVEKIQN